MKGDGTDPKIAASRTSGSAKAEATDATAAAAKGTPAPSFFSREVLQKRSDKSFPSLTFS